MSKLLPVAHKIPELWSLAKAISIELATGKYTELPPLLERIHPLLSSEMIDNVEGIVPGWRKISTLDDGRTAVHTLLVLATCLNLPEYQQARKETQFEIEWAAIFHDLDKGGITRDAAHPFRSAAVVAKIMPGLGFELQTGADERQLATWSALVMRAQRRDGDRMVHDHTHLEEIVDGMRRCWGENTTAIRILKAVLFHQSLPTLQDWANPVLVTDEELCYSLNLGDMEVLGPLMIADSDSWNIFEEARLSYLAELRANNAETSNRIKRCE